MDGHGHITVSYALEKGPVNFTGVMTSLSTECHLVFDFVWRCLWYVKYVLIILLDNVWCCFNIVVYCACHKFFKSTISWGQSWRSGTKCDWSWVRSPHVEMKYLLKFIFPFHRSGVEVLPLNTQCLQNSAESGERSVNSRFRLPTLLCAGYSVKLINFFLTISYGYGIHTIICQLLHFYYKLL